MEKPDFFKSIFIVLLPCILIPGCGGTRVFMGSYEYVKVVVSRDQAVMTAENLSEESLPGHLQKKSNASFREKTIDDNVYVYLESSDEKTRNELLNNVHCVAVDLKKPASNFKIISEVIIYPKRKSSTDPEKTYHEIVFKTKDGLDIGSHSILVRDPLAFTLCRSTNNDEKAIEMHITHSDRVKDNKLVIEYKETIFPAKIQLQVLSQIISTTRKPIRVIFVRV